MFIHITTPLTTVETTARYPLGSLYWESDSVVPLAARGNGGRLWQYVQNNTGAAWIAGNLVKRVDAANTKIATIHAAGAIANPNSFLGVAQHAIAAGSWGWILKQGIGTILADTTTGITAGQMIVASDAAAGSFDGVAATSTTFTLGYGVDTIAAAATGLAYINCPG